MNWPLLWTAVISVASLAYWHWAFHVVQERRDSGDAMQYRQWVYHNGPVSPPYHVRPFVPLLARAASIFTVRFKGDPAFHAFQVVSYIASAATPVAVYYLAGGGWIGLGLGVAFLGNIHLFRYNVQNPEMAESVGQLLMACGLLAIYSGHWVAYPVIALGTMTRETTAAVFAVIAMVINPWLLIGTAAGAAAVLLLKRPATDVGLHPLVEKDSYLTLKRWVKVKGYFAWHWTNVIQPLRGLPLVVPFTWTLVPEAARWSLLALIPIAVLSLPASGASRIHNYAWCLFVPFVVALPPQWIAIVAILSWFWPFDFSLYDESGGLRFVGLMKGVK